MKKRNYFLAIGAGIAILILFFAIFFSIYKEKEINDEGFGSDYIEENVTANSYKLANDCPESSMVGISISGDEIVNLYMKIARLEAELAACEETKGVKPKSPAPRTQKQKSATTTETRKAVETNTAVASKTSSSRVSSPNIVTSQYQGVISGDFGMTFDGDGKLFYYVKNEETGPLNQIRDRNNTETHLNGKFGVLGVQVGDYLIYKTKSTVTVDMLNRSYNPDDNDDPGKFAIYIGDHNQYNYDMWLPHEFVKMNESLAQFPGIEANEQGGFNYRVKINFTSKN